MEEKELSERNRSIRPLFSLCDSLYSLFRRTGDFSFGKFNFLKISSGFTLIELITAIGIFTILATVAYSTIDPLGQYRKAQDTRRKSDLAQLQRVLEAYYQDFGRYPAHTTTGEFTNTINTADGGSDSALKWGSTWAPYMDVLPVDPNSSKFYVYLSGGESNGFQTYKIYASLDLGSDDPDACNGGLKCTNVPEGIFCGLDNQVCNFGVTSPNISP